MKILHFFANIFASDSIFLLYSSFFHSSNPLPKSSNSIASPTTCRVLSALNGSRYWLSLICFSAAATPPFLVSFNSIT